MNLPNIGAAASQYKFIESNIAATSPETKLVGPNPNRVAIAFSSFSGQVGIKTTAFTGSVSTQMTFNLVANSPTLLFTFSDWGPWVQQEFHGTPTAGAIQVGILEIIYSPTGG